MVVISGLSANRIHRQRYSRYSYRWLPLLGFLSDIHHRQTFSLFDVCLVSAGQVQGLDTHSANNEQVENRSKRDRKT